MCGRFTLTLEAAELQEFLDLGKMPMEWTRRYNVAPSQPVAVVRDPEKRQIEWLRWGLIPFWAKDMSIGYKMINARSETVDVKPSFKNAFKQRRCLIPADGFYEWKKVGKTKGSKMPFYFQLKNEEPFFFAGLWETWTPQDGKDILSCTVLTTTPNKLVADVHDRMPVIFSRMDAWNWLAPGNDLDLKSLLKPFPGELMKTHVVSKTVNSPRNDSPVCVLPVDSDQQAKQIELF
ncbi:MAG: SOS response-associated peptidase [Anaerolineaceae bacterium]|nr:SOS response-associated peptidase [Anaerolineaceae bacterium]